MDKEEKKLIESMSDDEFKEYVIKSNKYSIVGWSDKGFPILPEELDVEEWEEY